MKIFISWSGERSEALAKALRDWLPLVLHYVSPWLSQSDIKAGDRWSIEIAKELENCNFGIICITRENLNAPWILFEAGALAKSMQDGRVIPLLLDLELKDLSGPLAQFQAKKSDETGMKELISSLNKSSAAPVPEVQLEKLFSALWTDLDKQLGTIPKLAASVKSNRSQGDILEELVGSVRNVEMKIRDSDGESSRVKRRRFRHHPDMLMDMMRFGPNRNGDALRYVVLFSFLKEELPWVFELAMELYRAQNTGNKQRVAACRKALMDALKMLRRGPFLEMMLDDKSNYFLFKEIEHILHSDFAEDPDSLGISGDQSSKS